MFFEEISTNYISIEQIWNVDCNTLLFSVLAAVFQGGRTH